MTEHLRVHIKGQLHICGYVSRINPNSTGVRDVRHRI